MHPKEVQHTVKCPTVAFAENITELRPRLRARGSTHDEAPAPSEDAARGDDVDVAWDCRQCLDSDRLHIRHVPACALGVRWRVSVRGYHGHNSHALRHLGPLRRVSHAQRQDRLRAVDAVLFRAVGEAPLSQ